MSPEERINILVRFGKIPAPELEMLQQFISRDNNMSYTRILQWHKRLKKGVKEVINDWEWETFNKPD